MKICEKTKLVKKNVNNIYVLVFTVIDRRHKSIFLTSTDDLGGFYIA